MTETEVFLTIALVHLIAVSSPGPDFAIVFRRSLTHGFQQTVPVALGIGSGILVHVCYSVLGLGLVIATNEILFNLLKTAGASYILYLAYQSWRSSGKNVLPLAEPAAAPKVTLWQAYKLGFLTNALNIKATMFFLSVYTLIAGNSPMLLQFAYGIYMSLATASFFTLMAWLLGGKMRLLLHKHLSLVEKTTALLLAAMAILIFLYNPPQF